MNTPYIFQRKRNKAIAAIVIIVLLLGAYLLISRLIVKKPPELSAPRIANVKITEDGLLPQTTLIKKGTEVIWTNVDSEPHKIASGPFPTHSNLPEFNSNYTIDISGTYRYTFDKTGTFTYQDDLNPELTGTIVVE